jgi:hypothetical protein
VLISALVSVLREQYTSMPREGQSQIKEVPSP